MSGKDVPFSYRLIGTRVDHADKTDNLAPDQEVDTFIDVEQEQGE